MKLNLTLNDNGELFDLNKDPYEEQNLFNEPKHQETIRSMKEKLIRWQIKNDDSFLFE